MCLAVPSKIVQIQELKAVVDVYGARREVSLMLMPEDVALGDYVLVHAGFAIQKVDHASAKQALITIKKLLVEIEEES